MANKTVVVNANSVSTGEKWSYDVRLVPINDTRPHPACIFIREVTESGDESMAFVPARVTGITELGEVSELEVATGQRPAGDLKGIEHFNPQKFTPTDLQYFGLKVHSLPDTVLANKRDITVKRLLG